MDHREDGQFWSTNDEPVERADSPACEPYSDDERPPPEPVISLFAIGKLCRLCLVYYCFGALLIYCRCFCCSVDRNLKNVSLIFTLILSVL